MNQANFCDIIRHLHRYAEGGYVNCYDILLASEIALRRKVSREETEEITKILTDLGQLGGSEVDPSENINSVLKYRIL